MKNQPFKIEASSRISRLPPYLFARINKMKYDKRVAGVDIIDLGMGNPTDPPPKAAGGARGAPPPPARRRRRRPPWPPARIARAVARQVAGRALRRPCQRCARGGA